MLLDAVDDLEEVAGAGTSGCANNVSPIYRRLNLAVDYTTARNQVDWAHSTESQPARVFWSAVYDPQKLTADDLAVRCQVNCGERDPMALYNGRLVVIDAQGRIEQDASGVARYEVTELFLGA